MSQEKPQEVRVIVVGDPHIKITEIEEANVMCEEVYRVIKEVQPDFVVCLGDVLDTHERVNLDPLERATEFLYKLSRLSPRFALLCGNHDMPNNSNFLTTKHSFNALKHWSNTTVVDKVHKERIKGMDFVFVPYVPPGRFQE